MERKTQELIDLSSGMESSRKRKQQLYQLFGSDSSDSSTSKDTYKPRRHKTVSFFFKLKITNETPNSKISMNQNTFFDMIQNYFSEFCNSTLT